MNTNVSFRPLSTFASWIQCRKLPSNLETMDGFINPDEICCPSRVGHVAVSIMDELLVWGGYYERSYGTAYCNKEEVWNYSLDMDRWYRYIPHGTGPHHTSGACSVIAWPYWYIILGHSLRGHSNQLCRLNLQTCTWETVHSQGPMISPRDKTVSWILGSRIFVFGGFGTVPHISHIWNPETDDYIRESWDDDRGWNNQLASFDTLSEQWQVVDTKGHRPSPRAAHSAVRVDMAVYIFGGRHRGQRMGDLHRLDLQEFTWSGALSCQGQKPEGRSWHTMTRLDRQNLILMGGYNDRDQILDDLWLLNVVSLSWSLLIQHTGRPRLWHTACTNSMGDMLIFGGCTNNILDDTTVMETSNLVLTVRREPYSLERLCMQAVWKHRSHLMKHLDTLPQNFQTWIKQRENVSIEHTLRFHQRQAYALRGPNVHQLGVLEPEEYKYVT